MKKFIALFAALVLCLSMASAAFAEATVTTINWEEVEAAAAEMDPDGQMALVFNLSEGQACIMWVPSVFQAVELADEDFEEGMLAVLLTEDEEACVEVFQMDIGEGTLADFAAQAADYGYTDVEPAVVNGIECLVMVDAENDTAVLLLVTDAGVAVAFGFTPASDEGFAVVAQMMMASIQVVEA